MNICRFTPGEGLPCVGLVEKNRVLDLSAVGAVSLTAILDARDPAGVVRRLRAKHPPARKFSAVRLLPPIERHEVWAAGVTYQRSKAARMDESDFSARAYLHVYEAPRPEIFFKAIPERVVGPGDAVGIRRDATWNVPEPELALVFNARGRLVGCTIGNDMSSRDIEGENLLYLPQAKVYDRSCALGPWITLEPDEKRIRRWTIALEIRRRGKVVFRGRTPVDRIKRSLASLGKWLHRSQTFPHGAVLLTGTGIVPPESFTLRRDDVVTIGISGIGTLENPVVPV